MRRSLLLSLVAITCILISSSAAEEPTANRRADSPNVVFFLIDDLGWTDLGCFGSSFYETPRIDELAGSGMKFTNAYAACPVCSPTRASILTGRYPTRTGITTYINSGGGNQPEKWKRNTSMLPAPYRDHLALEEVTLADLLKANGYATFFAGKWHLGSEGFWPEDQGFDVNMGGIDRGGPYGGKKYFSPYGNPRLEDGPDGEHLPDRLANETVEFITEHQEEPFLAYLSFYSVHTPLMSREDLRDKYLAKKEELGETGPIWGEEGSRKLRLVQEHAVYAGMVEAVDLAVGKVLQCLDDLELAENTIVIFMSDNGGLSTSEGHPTSNLPLRAGKGWLYEGGIREPMIVRWPGVTKAGSTCETPITSTDFFPTIIEMAGIEHESELPVDGMSFTRLLRGEEMERGPIFWHFPHYGNQGGGPGGAIRHGNMKLIQWYEDNRVELFDLSTDISEEHDLAAEQPDVAKRLLDALEEWKAETGAVMPTPNNR